MCGVTVRLVWVRMSLHLAYFDFLSADLSSSEYIMYSDGCTYQNRNSTMACVLSYFAITHSKIVTQKILEKGHTQMEVDSAHSTFERHLEKRQIYFPADYVSLVKETRQKPHPYTVEYLDRKSLKDFC